MNYLSKQVFVILFVCMGSQMRRSHLWTLTSSDATDVDVSLWIPAAFYIFPVYRNLFMLSPKNLIKICVFYLLEK